MHAIHVNIFYHFLLEHYFNVKSKQKFMDFIKTKTIHVQKWYDMWKSIFIYKSYFLNLLNKLYWFKHLKINCKWQIRFTVGSFFWTYNCRPPLLSQLLLELGLEGYKFQLLSYVSYLFLKSHLALYLSHTKNKEKRKKTAQI